MNLIKLFFRFILGSAYEAVINRKNYLIKRIKGSYFGLNEIDRKLKKYLNYKNGFFIELGANDGINQSNTLYYELKKGWKGLLIEPEPHNYLLCRKNRGKKNYIYCNACVSFEYNQKYVEMIYADLMSVSKGLKNDLTDIDEHINKSKNYSNSSIHNFKFVAIAKTLSSILDEINAPHTIDFMSLDVEGVEMEVLLGIDFNKYLFKYILIEIRDFERVNNFIESKGYKFIEKLSHQDFLFKYNF